METISGFLEAIFLSGMGWALWNWAWYNVEKNEYDDRNEDFPLADYKKKHKEEWIGSLMMAVFLLGGAQLMELVSLFGGPSGLSWSTAFYATSGIAWEGLLKFIKVFKQKK